MNYKDQIIAHPTPAYYFKQKKIKENYNAYKERLPFFTVYYSMKANGEEAVLKALHGLADGIEVANKEEFALAEKAGFSGGKIICSAPIKSIDCITYMYERGCRYFVYDTLLEFQKLQIYAPESKKIMRIYISDIDKTFIEFGSDYHDAIQTMPDGLTIHMSSHSNHLLCRVFDRIDKAMGLLYPLMSSSSQFIINLGGGYLLEHPIEYYEEIKGYCLFLMKHYPLEFQWIIEPGGGMVESAVNFVCRVENLKKKDNINYVYINGGISEGMQVKHGAIKNLTNSQVTRWRNIYVFFDTTCLHQRLFIYADRMVIEYQDILLFERCGAYTTCYINRFHAKRPPQMYNVNED